MTDEHDDLLREALLAESHGVTADDELLLRISAAADRGGGRWRQLRPWLGIAAAAAVVLGVAAVLLSDGDGDQSLDVVDAPATTPTTDPADSLVAVPVHCQPGEDPDLEVYMDPAADQTAIAEMQQLLASHPSVVSSRYVDQQEAYATFQELFADSPALTESVGPNVLPSSFVVAVEDGTDGSDLRAELEGASGVYEVVGAWCDGVPDGERPTLMALVREDGRLVTVDLETSEQDELHFAGDPNGSSGVEEGGPHFIDSVDLSPDGEWVYFSTCCEPAVGVTFRIPVTGGALEEVGFGAHPAVSPDGRFVAMSGANSVSVLATDDVGFDRVAVGFELTATVSSLAWSPDGRQLAVVEGRFEPDRSGQITVLAWDGATLTRADTGKPENAGTFATWTPDGTLNTVAGDAVEDDRDVSQDASYRWILWVDEEGVVREQAGHESGDRTPIDGLPEALAADW